MTRHAGMPDPAAVAGPSLPEAAVNDDVNQRAAERSLVKLMGRLREQGHSSLELEVHDLSTHGFQVETVYKLRPNTRVYLQIAGLAPLAARVKWFRDHRIGCAFEEPLHPAVYDRIVASAVPR